ncbi:Uncharacterized conserved protein YkwD, contains CAP (CSP/antigen 5/PR1) domain [Atopomonas hussainii]|uniref:Uncharacterized conserved protein YkwD, contains CAP (CSP/antigen 5/PR1) domain n=1 Tax=Atopomonas hussainii TaxID=1429083 RepID=A0A1H7R6T8_9GAMM|nr:Uncharacterized conserved protein YkwD, contains CAP (CSP/antigen 5/PR1) domain [Atopomonas hussainii]
MRHVSHAVAGLVLMTVSLCSQADPALIASLNQYRSEVQRCAGQGSEVLPPLNAQTQLQLPVAAGGDLQADLTARGYPMQQAQAVYLSGPRDGLAAFDALREGFCQVLLDPQYVDIGIARLDREWRIVFARPLLSGKLGDWQQEGEKLLAAINNARQQSRQCGTQAFAAAQPLSWQGALADAAHLHSRAMANGNFFAHKGQDGSTPGDRAELAGFLGGAVGENIAASVDSSDKVVKAWLASPSHCANLMNPSFTWLGAAYAADPKSDAGIYWTAVFAAP